LASAYVQLRREALKQLTGFPFFFVEIPLNGQFNPPQKSINVMTKLYVKCPAIPYHNVLYFIRVKAKIKPSGTQMNNTAHKNGLEVSSNK